MCEFRQKFNEKFRISSSRLRGWDYTKPGKYFVTICTYGKFEWFGKINEGKIKLSKIGIIVGNQWITSFKIRKNIEIDEWIIMPDHIHGIIIINYNFDVETPRRGASKTEKNKKITLKPNSISSIICQFKSNCTKQIRRIGCTEFKWQARFYDHIIRNDQEYYQIRNYIRNNPKRWEDKRRKSIN